MNRYYIALAVLAFVVGLTGPALVTVLTGQPPAGAAVTDTGDWKVWRTDPNNPAGCDKGIKDGSACQYSMVQATGDSGLLEIVDEFATVTFDPEDSTDGADDGQVRVRYCTTAVASVNTCNRLLSADTLTGAAGAAAMYEVPRGFVFIEVVAALGAGDNGIVVVTGSGPRGR